MVGQEKTLSIIKKAQKELLSPQYFYELCQEIIQNNRQKRLYFLVSNPVKFQGEKSDLNQQDVLVLLDYLAKKIKSEKGYLFKLKYYIRKIRLKLKKQTIKTIQIQNYPFYEKKN